MVDPTCALTAAAVNRVVSEISVPSPKGRKIAPFHAPTVDGCRRSHKIIFNFFEQTFFVRLVVNRQCFAKLLEQFSLFTG